MDKRFLGILAAIIIIFIGVFTITQHSSSNSSGGSKGTSKAQVSHNVQGQGAKGVTLVEWGDYECPICEAYYLPLKQAVAQNSSDIYFQFKNLPPACRANTGRCTTNFTKTRTAGSAARIP
jgi:hypothetical protein